LLIVKITDLRETYPSDTDTLIQVHQNPVGLLPYTGVQSGPQFYVVFFKTRLCQNRRHFRLN